jgi:hypothetical protein
MSETNDHAARLLRAYQAQEKRFVERRFPLEFAPEVFGAPRAVEPRSSKARSLPPTFPPCPLPRATIAPPEGESVRADRWRSSATRPRHRSGPQAACGCEERPIQRRVDRRRQGGRRSRGRRAPKGREPRQRSPPHGVASTCVRRPATARGRYGRPRTAMAGSRVTPAPGLPAGWRDGHDAPRSLLRPWTRRARLRESCGRGHTARRSLPRRSPRTPSRVAPP